MIQVFVGLFYVAISFILWTFGGYYIFMAIVSKFIKKKYLYDEKYTPLVSIIITAYNEEKVIKQKIENTLNLDYPKNLLEIIVVDDGSSDRTPEIVRGYTKYGIRLIRQSVRKGKPSAINLGIKHARGEIIIITDANSFFERDVVRKLVRYFSDPTIGGVSGRYEPKVTEGIGLGDKIYWKIEKFLKERESNVDSIIGMNGNIAAIRKNILETIRLKEDSVVEDFELTVEIRKKGYRIIYESEAYSWKLAPKNIKEGIMQKKRRSIGTIQTLMRNRNMLFNPKYGLYGLFILPSHKLFHMLTPFFIICIYISAIVIHLNIDSIFFHYISYLLLIALLYSLLSIIIPEKQPLVILPKYFLMLQFSVILAWIDYLRKKYNVTWEKAESTRDIR